MPTLLRPIRSRQQIGRYVTSRVQREFRPIAREMRRQALQLRGTQRQINQSYRGANQATRALADNLQQAHMSSVQNLGGVLNQLAATTRADAGSQAQAAQQDAAARGGYSNAGLENMAQQVAAGQADAGAGYLAALASQGQAAHTGLMSTLAANNARRMQDIGKVRSQRMDLLRDRRDLARERGRFKSEVLNDLRERERDYFIKRLAFRSDAADRAQRYDYNDAMREQARLGLAGDRARADANVRAAEHHRRGSEARARGNVRAAQIHGRGRKAAQQKGIRRGMALIRERARKYGGSWRDAVKQRGALMDALIEQGVDPAHARAAVNRYIQQGRKQERKRRGGLTLPDGRPVRGNTVRRR